MSGIKLIVFFFDGLDYHFICRNRRHSSVFSALFAEESTYPIQGVIHSLEYMSQFFTGRAMELFTFQGRESVPALDRIVNWDFLLSLVNKDQILWNRINHLGLRVGLVELLGVFLSPPLEGFSITKNLELLGLSELSQHGLTHYPLELGRQVPRLRAQLGRARPLRRCVATAASRLEKPLEQYTRPEVFSLMEACGYLSLPQVIEENLANQFSLIRHVLQEHPAEVLFFHTGYFDSLLHFFLERPHEERLVMGLLDRTLSCLEELFEPEEWLIFSDHGMEVTAPHLAEGLVYSAQHLGEAALLAGSGRRITDYLQRETPQDLTTAYFGALHSLKPAAERYPIHTAPLNASQVARQLEQVIAHRDRLMQAFDKEYRLSLEGMRERGSDG